MKLKYLPFSLFILLFVIFLVGCAGRAFKKAKEKNTIYSYSQFICKYGDSAFALQAKKLKEDLRFKEAKEQDTNSGYESYLHEYPNGTYVLEAKLGIERNDWIVAKLIDTLDGYKNFLSEHPDGQFVDDARNKITNIKVVENLIKKKKAEQKQKEEEFVYWRSITNLGTIEAYEDYIERYPKGQFAKEALDLINCIHVTQKGTIEEINQYLINLGAETYEEIINSIRFTGEIILALYLRHLKNEIPPVKNNELIVTTSYPFRVMFTDQLKNLQDFVFLYKEKQIPLKFNTEFENIELKGVNTISSPGWTYIDNPKYALVSGNIYFYGLIEYNNYKIQFLSGEILTSSKPEDIIYSEGTICLLKKASYNVSFIFKNGKWQLYCIR